MGDHSRGAEPKLNEGGNKGDCLPLPLWKRCFNALSAIMCYGICFKGENRPTSEIQINNTTVKCLWDTGADLCAMPMRTLKKLKIKPRLRPCYSTMTAANGQEIRTRGIARIDFDLGDNMKFYHDVIILDSLRADLILGVDLMKAQCLVIDMNNQKISKSPMEHVAPDIAVAPKTFSLEPLEAMALEIPSPKGNKIGQKYVASGQHVPQGITENSANGKNTILVVNNYLHPIQVGRGDELCTLEKVKDDEVLRDTELCRRAEMRINKVAGHHNKDMNTAGNVNKESISNDAIDYAIRDVPNEYKHTFTDLIKSFADVFSSSPDVVGRCDIFPQKITLIDKEKVACKRPYPIPPNLTPIVESYVLKLLKQKVIESSRSCFNSPLLLIRKPGPMDPNNIFKSYRIAHDFRLLNSNIASIKYPLNRTFNLVDLVAGGKILSVIDLSSGYWNNLLTEDSKKYTAFSVPNLGHFQYTRSAQGLKNSGACFQRMLDFIIAGIPDVYCFVDDVIISSSDMASHVKSLRQLFERFRQHGLKCRVHKVHLGAKSVKYLGWDIVANTSISPSEIKTKAIKDYKEPHNLTALRGFLGLTNFFRRTIPNFSQIASPLTKLTRKDSQWEGGPLPREAKNSFELLKQKLTSKPCLKPIDFKKPFYISIDSSAQGTGVVVSQEHGGIEYPNMYFSRSNPDCNKKQSAFAMEAAGLVWAMRQLRQTVLGSKCYIRLDHRPLTTVDKTSTPFLDKIYAELEDFDFTMIYMPGEHHISDGLSRQDDHKNCKLCQGKTSPRANIMTCAALSEEKAESSTSVSAPENVLHISTEQILSLQKMDFYCKAIICYLKYHLLPDKPSFRQWVLQMAPIARVYNGILGINVNGSFKIMAPLALRETLLYLAHDDKLSGHCGFKRCLDRLKTWYWPNMDQEVQNYCQRCVTCQRNNPPSEYTKMALGKLPDVHKFNSRIHIDLIGPLHNSNGLRYCLVITDAYSGYIKILGLPNKSAPVVARALYNGWICHFTAPLAITCDKGSEFKSEVVQELCKMLKCELVFASTDHAMGNGMGERSMRSLLSYLRKFIDNNPENWSYLLDPLMAALNTSISSSRLKTPFELCFGYPPTLPTNIHAKSYNERNEGFQQLVENHFKLQEEVRGNREEAYIRHKKYYDSKSNEQIFSENDLVYLKAPSRQMKLYPKWIGPLRIVKVKFNNNLLMKHLYTGKTYSAHCNNVKLGRYEHQLVNPTGSNENDHNLQTEEGERGERVRSQSPSNQYNATMGENLRAAREKVQSGSHLHAEVARQPQFVTEEQVRPRNDASVQNSQVGRKVYEPDRFVANEKPDGANFTQYRGPMTRSRTRGEAYETAVIQKENSYFAPLLNIINKWQSNVY